MKTVLVTGAAGFIGKNLCARLKQEGYDVLQNKKHDSPALLPEQIEKADFIFHCAGINRPNNEEEFDSGNRGLTEQVVSILQKLNRNTPILFTSSTQAEKNNPYGVSKQKAENILTEWSMTSGAEVYIFRLPNVFGKWAKPNYNSVVATFCNNIAKGLDITINDAHAEVTLVYIDDVISSFLSILNGTTEKQRSNHYDIPRKFNITIGELADKITSLHKIRETLIVPDIATDFDRYLYATYISYLPENNYDYPLDTKTDDRGWLAEFIKSPHSGQVFVSQTNPGFSRGNHWHHTKIEKFLVIQGEAEVKFRSMITDEVFSYKVSGKDLRVIDVPVGYVHSITNVGNEDLITVIWADEIFNPDKPDTFYAEV